MSGGIVRGMFGGIACGKCPEDYPGGKMSGAKCPGEGLEQILRRGNV